MKIKSQLKIHPLVYILIGCLLMYLAFRWYEKTHKDNISEAIVNYQLQGLKSDVIFVSVEGQDADIDFLKRFGSSKIILRRPSQGRVVKDGNSGFQLFTDKSTGKVGPLLNIGFVNWERPLRAQVNINYLGKSEGRIVDWTLSGWKVTGFYSS